MRVRKLPVEGDAVQWTGLNLDELVAFAGADNIIGPRGLGDPLAPFGRPLQLFVAANEAWLNLEVGEWVLQDARGYYPCKSDIFDKTYEIV